ncbi:MAG: hypothetical protein IJI68_12865 [Eggerthellaceae bacterium]|nr:hypothetical protein [Eggerthellaceae bacterium]
MASDTHDISRNRFMLTGGFAEQGYDWWWHSFSGHHAKTGERRTFFIEFFCCNPALGGEEPVFGQLPENREAGIKPSYVMVKAGVWGEGAKQLHRFFAWDDVDLGRGVPFYVMADDCLCCETDLIGCVEVDEADAIGHPEWMCDAGSMLWDLKVDKQMAFNVGPGASAPMRTAQAFEMFWHAEGIKCAYSGMVVLDGEVYLVDPENCFGYADKNWGSDFTSPWVWISSCNLVSVSSGNRLGNSALEIGGGRPRVVGHALDRKLLGCFNYEGRSYEFNFSKPWTGSTTKFDCWETEDALHWHVEQQTHEARLVTDVTCPKAEMLLVNYEAPNGTKLHNRLWNGGAGVGRVQLFERKNGEYVLVDDMRAATIGCEYGEYGS